MNAFFDERKNKISESLKRQKTVDAARKIAVFKTIQRQAGLRGLPTIPDVIIFFSSLFPKHFLTLSIPLPLRTGKYNIACKFKSWRITNFTTGAFSNGAAQKTAGHLVGY